MASAPPLHCYNCGASLLATPWWHDGCYPKFRCGTIFFNSSGHSLSIRCSLIGFFFRKKKLTYEQELEQKKIEQYMEYAHKQLDKELAVDG